MALSPEAIEGILETLRTIPGVEVDANGQRTHVNHRNLHKLRPAIITQGSR